jgi:hypothetical protein
MQLIFNETNYYSITYKYITKKDHSGGGLNNSKQNQFIFLIANQRLVYNRSKVNQIASHETKQTNLIDLAKTSKPHKSAILPSIIELLQSCMLDASLTCRARSWWRKPRHCCLRDLQGGQPSSQVDPCQ